MEMSAKEVRQGLTDGRGAIILLVVLKEAEIQANTS